MTITDHGIQLWKAGVETKRIAACQQLYTKQRSVP